MIKQIVTPTIIVIQQNPTKEQDININCNFSDEYPHFNIKQIKTIKKITNNNYIYMLL